MFLEFIYDCSVVVASEKKNFWGEVSKKIERENGNSGELPFWCC